MSSWSMIQMHLHPSRSTPTLPGLALKSSFAFPLPFTASSSPVLTATLSFFLPFVSFSSLAANFSARRLARRLSRTSPRRRRVSSIISSRD